MDKVNDDSSASGYGSKDAGTTTETTDTETQGDKSNDASKGAADQGVTDQKSQDADKSKQTSTTEDDVTGYNSKTDDKGEAKETAVTDDKPLELDAKGLPEDEIKSVQEFAKAHKLTKEQAQGLVDKFKNNSEAMEAKKAEVKQLEQQVYVKWEKELKDDPDFGGQNFDQNIHNVNKLIREELPGLKNLLTSAGKRLPPSVMKDLNSVARKLYSETEFNQGDKAGDKSSWHPTDFYKQKQ